ncbi:U32 family peptidase [bacterium]|nr:U32 family peptidase [bacterium]
MNNKKNRVPELLSPVGKAENLYAAIEAGADSVYLGYQKFNARGKAGNFNISELYSIREILKKNSVKMFVVLNTLIKERELNTLFDFLQLLNDISPDGVIIQDLGMLHLIQKQAIFSKKIELHASTQMSTFNRFSVKALQDLGITRVVPDRHLTLEEVISLKKGAPKMEIETFVHGAMCYALSGSCYFSSYLGGLSANRGLCAQVCRRKFRFQGDKEGYLYSLTDMNTIDILDKLVEAGIDALKIEGRMKSAEFVYQVTRAYRYLLDNLDNFEEAKGVASEILNSVVSRRESHGFYTSASPENITEPFQSGVYGNSIGKVKEFKNGLLTLELTDILEKNSRIRIHSPQKDTTSTIKVKELIYLDENQSNNRKNEKFSKFAKIPYDGDLTVEKGDLVYILETPLSKKWSSKIPDFDIKKIKLKPFPQPILKNQKIVQNRVNPRKKEVSEVKTFGSFYIKLSDFRYIPLTSGFQKKEIILTANDKNLQNINKYDWKSVWFSFPAAIFEKNWRDLEHKINFLLKMGVKKFEVTSLAIIELLKNKSGVSLISGPQINILNHQTVQFFNTKGVKESVFSYEGTSDELTDISKKGFSDNLIVPVFAKIRLFVSRAPHPLLKKEDFVSSQRGEKFIFRQNGEISETFSTKDFSLMRKISKLNSMGFSKFYIDLEHITTKIDCETTLKLLSKEKEPKESSTFNFFLDLK